MSPEAAIVALIIAALIPWAVVLHISRRLSQANDDAELLRDRNHDLRDEVGCLRDELHDATYPTDEDVAAAVDHARVAGPHFDGDGNYTPTDWTRNHPAIAAPDEIDLRGQAGL